MKRARRERDGGAEIPSGEQWRRQQEEFRRLLSTVSLRIDEPVLEPRNDEARERLFLAGMAHAPEDEQRAFWPRWNSLAPEQRTFVIWWHTTPPVDRLLLGILNEIADVPRSFHWWGQVEQEAPARTVWEDTCQLLRRAAVAACEERASERAHHLRPGHLLGELRKDDAAAFRDLCARYRGDEPFYAPVTDLETGELQRVPTRRRITTVDSPEDALAAAANTLYDYASGRRALLLKQCDDCRGFFTERPEGRPSLLCGPCRRRRRQRDLRPKTCMLRERAGEHYVLYAGEKWFLQAPPTFDWARCKSVCARPDKTVETLDRRPVPLRVVRREPRKPPTKPR